MGSRRFRSALKKDASPPTDFYGDLGAQSNVIKPTSTVTIELGIPSATFLVPGGRFLLTSSEASLKLWDLGFPFGEPSDPVLLCETQVETHPSGIARGIKPSVSMSVFPVDDDVLRVAIMLPTSK